MPHSHTNVDIVGMTGTSHQADKDIQTETSYTPPGEKHSAVCSTGRHSGLSGILTLQEAHAEGHDVATPFVDSCTKTICLAHRLTSTSTSNGRRSSHRALARTTPPAPPPANSASSSP